MFRYHWSRLRIELHVKTYEGVSEEKITQYFFLPSELEAEPTVSIAGKGILDYVLTIQLFCLMQCVPKMKCSTSTVMRVKAC